MFARSRFYTPPFELVPPSDWHRALSRLVKVLRRDDVKTVDALLAFVSRDYVTSRILAQLLFRWLPMAKRADGLVYKSGADWQAETGISEGQIKTRKNNGALEEVGITWVNKKANKQHTSHYGFDIERFVKHVAKCVGKITVAVRSTLFERSIQPTYGADQPGGRGESPVSLTDNHKQSQFVGVNDDSSLSGKVLDLNDALILKLVRAGLKRSSFREAYRSLPDDVIDACIQSTRDAQTANEIKYGVNAYLRGALDNQVEQCTLNPSIPEKTDGIDPVPTEDASDFNVPEKCEKCGKVPHWLSGKCGCTEDTLSQAPDVDDALMTAWTATYNQLELQLDRTSFETWLKPAELLRVEEGVYVVGVHNDYARDMLQHRLYRNVRRVLSSVTGQQTELVFEVKG